MDNFENLEWEAPAFDYAAEMKKIRKSLRKRNALIVCTSLVLVAALAFGFIQYGIPALEKQYWDPNTCTYAEGITDLQLTMATYTELFFPQYDLFDFEITDTGFATYTITASFSKWTSNDSIANSVEEPRSAVISRNELSFSAGFWDYILSDPFNMKGGFDRGSTGRALSNLKKYPEYVNVLAAVTFPEDNYDFYSALGLNLIWAAVRTGDDYASSYPACGYSLRGYGSTYSDVFGRSSEYPYLVDATSSSMLEVHFKSMLKYLRDQQEKGTGILPPDDRQITYYADALEYVEEHGVKVYGGYAICSPQTLLELYESGAIENITLCDVWINY